MKKNIDVVNMDIISSFEYVLIIFIELLKDHRAFSLYKRLTGNNFKKILFNTHPKDWCNLNIIKNGAINKKAFLIYKIHKLWKFKLIKAENQYSLNDLNEEISHGFYYKYVFYSFLKSIQAYKYFLDLYKGKNTSLENIKPLYYLTRVDYLWKNSKCPPKRNAYDYWNNVNTVWISELDSTCGIPSYKDFQFMISILEKYIKNNTNKLQKED